MGSSHVSVESKSGTRVSFGVNAMFRRMLHMFRPPTVRGSMTWRPSTQLTTTYTTSKSLLLA